MMDHRRGGGRQGRPGQGNWRPPARRFSGPPRNQERRGPRPESRSSIDPFALFCAYHLGIGPDKSYRPANIHDVARQFGVDAAVIREALQATGMDAETMLEVDFDLTMAQLDIQVAPEGIDRIELAKGIFEEFRAAPRRKRDWQKLLAEDARENSRTFGRR